MLIQPVATSRLVNTREVGEMGRAASSSANRAGNTDFAQALNQALGDVNGALNNADVQAQQVATGEAKDVHSAMVSVAEADLALQVTMRVVQKALSAYQEISRMQI